MISLNKSIRTAKVNDGYAPHMESDRFLNPLSATCPKWNGHDLVGRKVSQDSFYTKSAGCNSAIDRVSVENSHRPRYSGFVGLNMRGLVGGSDLVGNNQNNMKLRNMDHTIASSGPSYGNNLMKNVNTNMVPYSPIDYNYTPSIKRKYSFVNDHSNRNNSKWNKVEGYTSPYVDNYSTGCASLQPSNPIATGSAEWSQCNTDDVKLDEPSNSILSNVECTDNVCRFK